ncbi:MAG TPA: sorbitol-6-phosphate dehydrogenase [Chthonomonadales bacterium]|nr:sorbitol-6-phosphate dehydrogenase [Chthonomonadales bacterium]
MKRLQDRVAVITGAAQGLGEAIADRLAAEGCSGVTIADVNMEKALETAARIASERRCRTIAVRADVTSEEEVEALFTKTVDAFGQVDILVANAGILVAESVADFPAAKWRKVLDVNLYGYFLCARSAARLMIPRKSGSIVQINSKSGKLGSFRNSAYAASKFGGIGLTQSLALELAPYDIRVNAVCPGNLLDGTLWQQSLYEQYARTQGLTPEQVREKYESKVPLGRGCTYDDVCNVVAFLLSDEASYMTGQAINVAGGQEMR